MLNVFFTYICIHEGKADAVGRGGIGCGGVKPSPRSEMFVFIKCCHLGMFTTRLESLTCSTMKGKAWRPRDVMGHLFAVSLCLDLLWPNRAELPLQAGAQCHLSRMLRSESYSTTQTKVRWVRWKQVNSKAMMMARMMMTVVILMVMMKQRGWWWWQ